MKSNRAVKGLRRSFSPISILTSKPFASVGGLGVLVGLFGLFIRIWALGRHEINADEAVVGLMAEQILHGHFSAFYWGQSYGAGEPYAVALVFAIFGPSTFSLGLTPVLLDLVATVLVWRIGRRLFNNQIGLEAALLFWIWPEVYIWQSTIEYGFRWFVLDLGLGATLFALRYLNGDSRSRRVEMLGMGLLLGAGWWGSPEIMYFLLPIAVSFGYCVVRKHPRVARTDLLIAIAGALAGASAWLEVNLGHHFVSLHSKVQPDPGIFHHLKVFVQHTLPLLFGLQLRISGRWLFGASFGPLVNLVAIGVGIIVLFQLIRRKEATGMVIFCIVAPVVYGLSPFTWYWADGRYAVFLAPATALMLVVSVREILLIKWISRVSGNWQNVVRPVLVIAFGLSMTLFAASKLAPYRPNGVVESGSATWTSWTSDPSSGFSSIANRLESSGIRDIYAGYWVAYPLMFASKDGLVASDISFVRNPGFLTSIEHNKNSAWLFLDPSEYRLGVALTGVSLMDPNCAALTERCLLPSPFMRYLTKDHIGYRRVSIAPFIAVIPDRPVPPTRIISDFHLSELSVVEK
ncbi:MAG TPA: glycosyltransferase family 39 protein [Acidimicrobiales bacterium]|nr:glycosyltransferase family 39 protein [Acidimicrobiales bacterium]